VQSIFLLILPQSKSLFLQTETFFCENVKILFFLNDQNFEHNLNIKRPSWIYKKTIETIIIVAIKVSVLEQIIPKDLFLKISWIIHKKYQFGTPLVTILYDYLEFGME
jgi:hypothetical protein